MSVTTMWIHGNALVVEDPGEYAVIRHRGWGTELDFNSFDDDESYHNSHIPIPTPASVDGALPMLTQITILFETTSDLYIQQVDVWDGNVPVAQFPCYSAPDPPPGAFTGNLSHSGSRRDESVEARSPVCRTVWYWRVLAMLRVWRHAHAEPGGRRRRLRLPQSVDRRQGTRKSQIASRRTPLSLIASRVRPTPPHAAIRRAGVTFRQRNNASGVDILHPWL